MLLSAMESCVVSTHTGHGSGLIVFFETIVPADSRSFCKVFGSVTTILIIIFIHLSEILWGAPSHAQFMVKLCFFYFWVMATAVLTGTFGSSEILF